MAQPGFFATGPLDLSLVYYIVFGHEADWAALAKTQIELVLTKNHPNDPGRGPRQAFVSG